MINSNVHAQKKEYLRKFHPLGKKKLLYEKQPERFQPSQVLHGSQALIIEYNRDKLI